MSDFSAPSQASEEARLRDKATQDISLAPSFQCVPSILDALILEVSRQALERAATEAEDHFAGANVAAAIRRLKPEGR